MFLHLTPSNASGGRRGFTLVEVLISFFIFGMVVSGMIYGYVQINRMAEWSSMSLAAQSYASEGLEQAKSAQWDYVMWPVTNGPGTGDERGFTWLDGTGASGNGYTNYVLTDTMDVPTSGSPISVKDYITISNIYPSSNNIPLRLIRSDCVWTNSLDGKVFTNTAIALRAPDQ